MFLGKLLVTDGNTDFEELGCVGLNPNEDALVGMLTVELPNGYSGSLCTAGSKEYVAFWIDFDSGYTCAGATSVNVYHLSVIPPRGVQYSVFLPVDLSGHPRPCGSGPVTTRVRAILSWQVQPPPGNPNFVPTWGNREEALIHIHCVSHGLCGIRQPLRRCDHHRGSHLEPDFRHEVPGDAQAGRCARLELRAAGE